MLEYKKLAHMEETSWKQKSRALWQHAGNRMSSFVHRLAKFPWKNQFIGNLLIHWVSHSEDGVGKEGTIQFYKRLYSETTKIRYLKPMAFLLLKNISDKDAEPLERHLKRR